MIKWNDKISEDIPVFSSAVCYCAAELLSSCGHLSTVQVKELPRFYDQDEEETCRQARAHFGGTPLVYVRRAPFKPMIDLALPFMDYYAKEVMITDQFLLGMGNHELSIQWLPMGTNE